MIGQHLGVASIAVFTKLGVVTAFGWTSHHNNANRLVRRSQIHHGPLSRSYLHASSTSQEKDQSDEQQDKQLQHPHSKLWSTTLETSPNSYVNPSVDLAIRPPSEGGTGIIAVDDTPTDTVAMCLPLEEVGMIDATSILDAYNEEKGRDEVLSKLKEMWSKELASNDKQKSEQGIRLAVLAGVIAHLQLTRYKDLTSWTASKSIKEGSYALEQSRRLGLFLDAMPLLPQHDGNNNNNQHPFPTHFLYWTDDEVQILLHGTMGQTKAREVRAGIGLVVREWSPSFLKEHSSSGACSQTQILNAMFSAFTAVLSRSFGDAAGRDLDGKGRMLVPLVDMLNHDGEDPNVKWTWHVGEGDEDKIQDGKGDIVVTTLRNVTKGEELLKCYGWRPAWDIASTYGFVPQLKRERWECAVIPLFPEMLDLDPDAIPTPSEKAKDETTVDMLLESNYGTLVKAVIAAVNAANEVKARQKNDVNAENEGSEADRPEQLNRLEVVSLFRPPPKATADKFPFPRRQPCVIVGTKIQASVSASNDHCHRHAIESVLPAFRAAASAISQLRKNHKASSGDDHVSPPIEASQMAMAAASLDKGKDWDEPAMELLNNSVKDRLRTLIDDGETATEWVTKRNSATGIDDENMQHQQFRAGVAHDVREAEFMVLRTLQKTASEW